VLNKIKYLHQFKLNIMKRIRYKLVNKYELLLKNITLLLWQFRIFFNE